MSWKITGGSIPGSDHVGVTSTVYKNNQDAFFTHIDEEMAIGIVADGCSSGVHSEVGSKMGVSLLGELIKNSFERSFAIGNTSIDWTRLQVTFLSQLSVIANSMGNSLSKVVEEYFLFTIVGFVITQYGVVIFNCGDGVYSVDGKINSFGPFPNNEPPYFSYGILGKKVCNFNILPYPIGYGDLTSIVIGSDGVELISELPEKLEKWFSMEKMFSNSDLLRRQLSIMNKPFKNENGAFVPGPLKDDVTLIIAINDKGF